MPWSARSASGNCTTTCIPLDSMSEISQSHTSIPLAERADHKGRSGDPAMSIHSEDIWRHLDGLTKPPRSLGRLEELAARLCQIQQTLVPQTSPRRLVIFAADHGVARAGVTIWPSAVTSMMVRNMCSGGAASTVLARQSGTDVVLVNVGTYDEPLAELPAATAGFRYRDSRVTAGTRNLSEEPALSPDEFQQAWDIGCEEAQVAARDGVRVVLAGEMGIGNTTPAACLAMLLAEVPLSDAVGRGAGADDATLERKCKVVEQAVARAAGFARTIHIPESLQSLVWKSPRWRASSSPPQKWD